MDGILHVMLSFGRVPDKIKVIEVKAFQTG